MFLMVSLALIGVQLDACGSMRGRWPRPRANQALIGEPLDAYGTLSEMYASAINILYVKNIVTVNIKHDVL